MIESNQHLIHITVLNMHLFVKMFNINKKTEDSSIKNFDVNKLRL